MNKLVATIIGVGTLSMGNALAVDTGCNTPTQPTLPSSITSQAQANSLEATTLSYLEEVTTYKQCLVDWANAQTTLSDTDKTELRALYDTQTNASTTYTNEWNQKMSAYLQAQNEN